MKIMQRNFLTPIVWLAALVAIGVSPVPAAAAEVTQEQIKGLDEQVQDIKQDVLEITTELSLLEEKLLFPSNTQVSLFVSLTGNEDFVLDAMQIEVDGKVVAKHLYTYKELEALRLGGVQRIFTGNINTGDHVLTASYIARSAGGDELRGSNEFTVTKAIGPKFVEIIITGGNVGGGAISFQDW